MIQYANIGTAESRQLAVVLEMTFTFQDEAGQTWEDLTAKTIRLRWYKDHLLAFELTGADAQVVVAEDTVILSPDASPLQADTPRPVSSGARYATWGALPPIDYTFRLDIIDPGQDAELGLVCLWQHQATDHLNGTAAAFENTTTVDSLGQAVEVIIGGSGGGGGTDDQVAAEVPFTPAGGIVAANVQDALEEVGNGKANTSGVLLLARKVIAGSGNSSGVGFYRITGASVTLTFTSADIANSVFVAAIKNESATTATLATQGSETIEGFATLPLFAGGAVWLYSDGVNLRQIMP